MQALDEFKEGKVTVLVATDIAARGLDIEELPFVVNYELPHTPGGLRAPHRPHRPRRPARRGDFAGGARRDEVSGGHRAAAQAQDAARHRHRVSSATAGRGEPAPSRGHAPAQAPRTAASRRPARIRQARERHAPPPRGPRFRFHQALRAVSERCCACCGPGSGTPAGDTIGRRPPLLGGSGAKHPHKKS